MTLRSTPACVAGPAARRRFLKQLAALGTMTGPAAPLALNLLAAGEAAAQAAPDYKALVCLFLFGGNDTYNMVLPTDAGSWAAYTATRNQAPSPIALLAPGVPRGGNGGSPQALGGVLPIAPLNAQGRGFALHPAMGPLQPLFDTDRRLAIVPNSGPLVMPTTKAQYGQASHPKPAQLFSHNDQQNTWMALAPEGATLGWGGRLADLVAGQNGRPVFTAISASGNAVWLNGQSVRQYQVGTSGAVRMGADGGGRIFGSAAVAAAMQRIAGTARSSHVMQADLAALSQRTIDAENALRSALKPASDAQWGTPAASYSVNNDPKLRYLNPLNGQAAANPLAQQLQIVARMIDASSNAGVGARRQVFFVSVGGFDTHDNQNDNHAGLMARLAHAMRYFDDTLGAMGARDRVTLFTASDFGRTFTSNGDGTDHGWGAHHFVLGGAVRGGDLYGRFPTLAAKNASNNGFDGSGDQLGNGALLPATSVDQIGATLGRWFGASDTALLDVFPHLANFSQRDLGFMG